MTLRRLPSVDRLLGTDIGETMVGMHGRIKTTEAIRSAVETMRGEILNGSPMPVDPSAIALASAFAMLDKLDPLRPCLNLTGTVLHTNLGRALLPDEAIEAAAELSAKHINDRQLPDKAIDVIDEVGAAQRVANEKVRQQTIE